MAHYPSSVPPLCCYTAPHHGPLPLLCTSPVLLHSSPPWPTTPPLYLPCAATQLPTMAHYPSSVPPLCCYTAPHHGPLPFLCTSPVLLHSSSPVPTMAHYPSSVPP